MKMISYCILVFLLFIGDAQAFAEKWESINRNGSIGTEFIFSTPPLVLDNSSAYVTLYFCGQESCSVDIEISSNGYRSSVVIAPNKTTSVTIPHATACPQFIRPGFIAGDSLYHASAIHVRSEKPITLSCSVHASYSSETFSVLPVSGLGRKYIISTAQDVSAFNGTSDIPAEACFIAAHDNTHLSFKVGGNERTCTQGGLRYGQTMSLSMNKGDVWMIRTSSTSIGGDLTGTIVEADKPFAVLSANVCANVPAAAAGCGYIVEMEIPTSAWGQTYFLPINSKRAKGYFMRVQSSQPKTKLFYNSSYWRDQSSDPVTKQNEIYQRVDATGNNVVTLQSTAPIGVTVFNPGLTDDTTESQPFQMTILPLAQFYKSVFFSTPGLRGGQHYSRCSLGVIFKLDSAGRVPNDLQFGTDVNGVLTWRKFSDAFGSTIEKNCVYRIISSDIYVFKEIVLPSDGVFAMRANSAFMCYMYGEKPFESFGHPVAPLLRDLSHLEDQVPPKFEADWTKAEFRGTVTDYPESPIVRSNLSHLFLNYGSSNMSLSCPEIWSDTIRSMNFVVSPVDPRRDAIAYLTVSDRAGNDTTVEVRWTAFTQSPKITADADLNICDSSSVTFHCTSGFQSYSWSDGQIDSTARIFFGAPGDFPVHCTVEESGGTKFQSDTLWVHVNARPAVPQVSVRDTVIITPASSGLRYQWYYNGISIGGPQSNEHRILRDGWYKVKAINSVTGCERTSAELYVTKTNLEWNNTECPDYFPNPAQDYITVSLGNSQTQRVEIVSVEGVILKSIDCINSQTNRRTIQIDDLARGCYFIRMFRNEAIVQGLFVKD